MEELARFSVTPMATLAYAWWVATTGTHRLLQVRAWLSPGGLWASGGRHQAWVLGLLGLEPRRSRATRPLSC